VTEAGEDSDTSAASSALLDSTCTHTSAAADGSVTVETGPSAEADAGARQITLSKHAHTDTII
jgi:hypothetical protein